MGNTIWPKRLVAGNNAYATASSGIDYTTGSVNATVDVVRYPFSSVKNPSTNITITFDLSKFDSNFVSQWYFEFVPNSRTLTFSGIAVNAGLTTNNFEGGSQPSLSSSYNLFHAWTVDGITVNIRKVIGY